MVSLYRPYFFRWENELKSFMQNLNQFHPNLNFTYESIKKEIAFLDWKVNLFENKLTTALYVKPTDTHQYLEYTSSHPEHTKKSIVYSQTLRLRRICSFETDFLKRKNEMKSWFLKRGYPERLIDKEMKKFRFNTRILLVNIILKKVCSPGSNVPCIA